MPIEPIFTELPEMCFVGVSRYGNLETLQIGTLWDVFNKIEKGIENRADTTRVYGIELYPPEFPNPFAFTYLAAAPVKNLSKMPIHTIGKILPASLYAVFKVDGGISELPATFKYAYSEWLPKSRFESCHPFDFELYQMVEGKPACQSDIFVYIPVKEKK